jgi:hydrogenase nickel incorporation protein HypB
LLQLEQKVLAKNDAIAAYNRGWFSGRGIVALNVMSSPGAGKTSLLVRTIRDLAGHVAWSVIEGDQATANDAERIRATGCKVVQINTGQGCHLEANMVQQGYLRLSPPPQSILVIENVGNLVCPSMFDLGESARIAVLSVTEGEDKPIKYPHLFRTCDVVLLNKIDLLPYVPFDCDRCLDYLHQVNPGAKVFLVSALSGEGLAHWYEWLVSQMGQKAPALMPLWSECLDLDVDPRPVAVMQE